MPLAHVAAVVGMVDRWALVLGVVSGFRLVNSAELRAVIGFPCRVGVWWALDFGP